MLKHPTQDGREESVGLRGKIVPLWILQHLTHAIYNGPLGVIFCDEAH